MNQEICMLSSADLSGEFLCAFSFRRLPTFLSEWLSIFRAHNNIFYFLGCHLTGTFLPLSFTLKDLVNFLWFCMRPQR